MTNSTIGGPDPHQRNLASATAAQRSGSEAATSFRGTTSAPSPGTSCDGWRLASREGHSTTTSSSDRGRANSHGCSGACNLVSGNQRHGHAPTRSSRATTSAPMSAAQNGAVGSRSLHALPILGILSASRSEPERIAFNGGHGRCRGRRNVQGLVDCEFVPALSPLDSIHDNAQLHRATLACFGRPTHPGDTNSLPLRQPDYGRRRAHHRGAAASTAGRTPTISCSSSVPAPATRDCFYGKATSSSRRSTARQTGEGDLHARPPRSTQAISATATDVANGGDVGFGSPDLSITKTDDP